MRKALGIEYRAFGCWLSITVLAGCNVPAMQSGATSVLPSSAARHDAGARSWMAAKTKGMQLLYVSDFFGGAVDVYSYPAGKLVGQLKVLGGPQGECVDASQNVWITEQATNEIVEYAHGGTTPIATLSDPGVDPLDCSVDPSSGNLAVTNYSESGSSNEGSVAIYARASGAPQLYQDGRQIWDFYSCSYDGQGNLFVDGTQFPYQPPFGEFQFGELPKGSSSFTNLTLQPEQNVALPGGIHWDGTYIALGNLTDGVIYQLSGSQVVHTVSLKRARGAADFFFDGKAVIVGLDNGAGRLGVWKYPGGGKAIKKFQLPSDSDPVAELVVSK